jgi:hypothetical protein
MLCFLLHKYDVACLIQPFLRLKNWWNVVSGILLSVHVRYYMKIIPEDPIGSNFLMTSESFQLPLWEDPSRSEFLMTSQSVQLLWNFKLKSSYLAWSHRRRDIHGVDTWRNLGSWPSKLRLASSRWITVVEGISRSKCFVLVLLSQHDT